MANLVHLGKKYPRFLVSPDEQLTLDIRSVCKILRTVFSTTYREAPEEISLNHIALLLPFLVLPILGCVSVNLGTDKIEKASDIRFQEPKSPFKKVDNPTVDVAWQNLKNGNTIAFLSECKIKAEISLQTMEAESLAALTGLKTLKSEIKEYNEREAKEVLAEGQVDGISVKIQLILFKKNNCNYTISYVGRKKVFDQDSKEFQIFLSEFSAP